MTIDKNENHPDAALDDAVSLLNRVFTGLGFYVDKVLVHFIGKSVDGVLTE
ncbi:MAG: hypothetical protein LBS49_14010 [Candidatus Accumulibacter sp.]|nr:hypothetical protein [Accumulibacter sp.]